MDNGEISRSETALDLPGTPHAYHLIPAVSSKAAAVALHMRARGYAPEECIAVGDSREDLEVAEVVGRLFLVANAAVGDGTALRQRGAHRGGHERGLLRGGGPRAGGKLVTSVTIGAIPTRRPGQPPRQG